MSSDRKKHTSKKQSSKSNCYTYDRFLNECEDTSRKDEKVGYKSRPRSLNLTKALEESAEASTSKMGFQRESAEVCNPSQPLAAERSSESPKGKRKDPKQTATSGHVSSTNRILPSIGSRFYDEVQPLRIKLKSRRIPTTMKKPKLFEQHLEASTNLSEFKDVKEKSRRKVPGRPKPVFNPPPPPQAKFPSTSDPPRHKGSNVSSTLFANNSPSPQLQVDIETSSMSQSSIHKTFPFSSKLAFPFSFPFASPPLVTSQSASSAIYPPTATAPYQKKPVSGDTVLKPPRVPIPYTDPSIFQSIFPNRSTNPYFINQPTNTVPFANEPSAQYLFPNFAPTVAPFPNKPKDPPVLPQINPVTPSNQPVVHVSPLNPPTVPMTFLQHQFRSPSSTQHLFQSLPNISDTTLNPRTFSVPLLNRPGLSDTLIPPTVSVPFINQPNFPQLFTPPAFPFLGIQGSSSSQTENVQENEKSLSSPRLSNPDSGY